MRWRKKICIDKYVENMQTKEDFENFLVWLLEDVKKNKNRWENQDLESYLNALHGFVHDIEEYRQPSWRMLADMLLAARVYENGNSNSEECR